MILRFLPSSFGLLLCALLLLCSSHFVSTVVAAEEEGETMSRGGDGSPLHDDTSVLRPPSSPSTSLFSSKTSSGAFEMIPVDSAFSSTQPSRSMDTASGVRCLFPHICNFYKDVLLVIKLNPTRVLWVDALRKYYGAGFPHIVFFSALKKRDPSHHKFLNLGIRPTTVHLLDDNYGFCDHETVRVSSEWWPSFRGYFFLSDDVLMQYWKFLKYDKRRIWRQPPQWTSMKTMNEAELRAVESLFRLYPSLRGSLMQQGRMPFASTSGIYYLPRVGYVLERFANVSAILMRHRTYNEWGTPIAISAAQTMMVSHAAADGAVHLKGKLVWGAKRFKARRAVRNEHLEWYHPVKANGETFARYTLWLYHIPSKKLRAGTSPVHEDLFQPCLNCATHPQGVIARKGLYHSCFLDAVACPSLPTFDDYTKKVVEEGRLRVPSISFVGGRVIVPRDRRMEPNPLELDHEGFWGAEVTDFVFQTYYKRLNDTTQRGELLSRYPFAKPIARAED